VISPDGKYVAGIGDSHVTICERETGIQVARMRDDDGIATLLAFAPSGRVLACGTVFGRLVLREIPSGKVLQKVPLPEDNVHRLQGFSFSGDGRLVAIGLDTAQPTGKAFVCEVATGKPIATVELLQKEKCATALSPDGKWLATWGAGLFAKSRDEAEAARTIQLWDLPAGTERQRIKLERVGFAACVTFTPDSKAVVIDDGQGFVHFFDVESGKKLRHFGGRGGIAPDNLQFSPDGHLLVSAGSDGTVRVWEAATGERIKLPPYPEAKGISFSFAEKKQLIALGVISKSMIWWEPTTGKRPKASPGHYGPVIGVAFTVDGKLVRSASLDGGVVSWDRTTGKRVHETTLPARLSMRSLTLSGDARFGMTNSFGFPPGCQFWDLAKGDAVRLIPQNSGDVLYERVAFAANGRRLAAVGEEFLGRAKNGAKTAARNVIDIWGTGSEANGKPDRIELPGTDRFIKVVRLACSSDGSRVAVATSKFDPGNLKSKMPILVFDSTTGKQVFSVDGASVPLEHLDQDHDCSIAFSPDSKLFAFPSANQQVTVVGCHAGAQVRQLELDDRAATVTAVAFSPDGRILAVASRGERKLDSDANERAPAQARLDVWEIASGQLRTRFIGGHIGGISSLAFSPDSVTLASGGEDTLVFLWDAGGLFGAARTMLTAKEVKSAWASLGLPDARAAFRAQCLLIQSPAEATAFLQASLKPTKAPTIDEMQVQQWLANLNSDDFVARTQAHEGLDRLGPFAEPALRKAQASSGSLEQRRRIEQLLGKLERRNLSREELQAIRAIEVLERIGTQEARALVHELATGALISLQTRHAASAAARMTR
jgi:WD40 repeat protein